MLEEGAARPGREQGHASLGVAGVLELLAGVPVVEDLVVVPDHHLRDLGLEAAHVLVQTVVEVVAAELVEGLGDLRLRGRDQVPPDRAVVERALGGERLVGVDRVAAVHEEVGGHAPHRLVEPHPAPRLVDAPPLPAGVGGEGEAHVGGPGGRGAKRALDRPAPGPQVAQVLEEHAVDDTLAGREAIEVDPGREAVRLERGRPGHPADLGKGLARRPLHEEAGGSVGARPDDRPVAGHVADRRTEGRRRSGRLGGHDRGGARERPRQEGRTEEPTPRPHRAAQEPPARPRPLAPLLPHLLPPSPASAPHCPSPGGRERAHSLGPVAEGACPGAFMRRWERARGPRVRETRRCSSRSRPWSWPWATRPRQRSSARTDAW